MNNKEKKEEEEEKESLQTCQFYSTKSIKIIRVKNSTHERDRTMNKIWCLGTKIRRENLFLQRMMGVQRLLLQRGPHSWQPLLLLQGTRVWLPAPTGWLTTICNSRQKGALFDCFRHQVCGWCTYRHVDKTFTYNRHVDKTFTHKIKWINLSKEKGIAVKRHVRVQFYFILGWFYQPEYPFLVHLVTQRNIPWLVDYKHLGTYQLSRQLISTNPKLRTSSDSTRGLSDRISHLAVFSICSLFTWVDWYPSLSSVATKLHEAASTWEHGTWRDLVPEQAVSYSH